MNILTRDGVSNANDIVATLASRGRPEVSIQHHCWKTESLLPQPFSARIVFVPGLAVATLVLFSSVVCHKLLSSRNLFTREDPVFLV